MDKPVEYMHVFVVPGVALVIFGLAIVGFVEIVPPGPWHTGIKVIGWSLMIIGHILSGVAFFQTRRLKRRLARGLCPNCGYDLRATPDRCPECGIEAESDEVGQV